MSFSKRTEYGLRAVVQLARLWPAHLVQARDLAKTESLPIKFLESILLALKRGEFLESKVGSGGGYRLTRAPDKIFVGDILRRLEGNNSTTAKPSTDLTPGQLAVQLLKTQLDEASSNVLDTMTLQQLVDQVNQSGAGHVAMYYI